MDKQLDINTLTLKEIEDIEDVTDAPFSDLFEAGKKKAKALRAMAWILERRINPAFTFEDAGNLSIQDISGLTDPKA